MFLQKKRFYILGRGFVSVGAATPTDFEETDFAATNFWEIWFRTFNFSTKMPIIFIFLSKYENPRPQFWYPNDGPVW